MGQSGADTITVYADYSCPYCYLLEPALRRLEDEADVSLAYRAFELSPAPAPLPAPDDEALRRAWRETVAPAAERLGVEIREPGHRPRTRKAHELAAHGREKGRFGAVHEALFRAHFVDGLDIGRIDVLVDVAEAAGLDADEAHRALGLDLHTDRVLDDERVAAERGIDRVPTLEHRARLLIGLQPYERLEAWAGGGEPETGQHTQQSQT